MRILIIGNLGGQIGAASQIAIQRGAEVVHVHDIAPALEILRSGQGADLVMVDVVLDIKVLVESLATERISVPVVACGIAADAKAAVRAIKAGAKEYIPLPPDAELIGAVLTAVSMEKHSLIYKDKATEAMVKMAEQIAPSVANVLITGESGTGKEVIARFLHTKSKRANNRFIAVNCAAIPDNLLESELFGYEKGAFTGAVARRIGKFEEASGGTLLLDEISEMDIRLQAKLLRAIQEKEIDRIGGKTPVSVDVRVLATSNRNLSEEVKNGNFREDLYFRLNVINLAIPPLRERPEDIIPLAEFFINKYSEMNEIPEKPLSEAAKNMLIAYRWPGNVRELENTMHRAVLLSAGSEIAPEAIILTESPSSVAAAIPAAPAALTPQAGSATPAQDAPAQPYTVGQTVSDVEKNLIIDTLKHTLGNRTHAANILGISIRTLRNKLKQYADEGNEIPPPAGE
ncbi:MAG: sigma-54-dependent Fis family transcriptional regulator [Alphaproteobacteria bacterium]|nr:sigma-54-dependent Fis family transcriptional regulator [Alphaproteobacteria bacterium]